MLQRLTLPGSRWFCCGISFQCASNSRRRKLNEPSQSPVQLRFVRLPYLKSLVFNNRSRTLEDLKTKIREKVANIRCGTREICSFSSVPVGRNDFLNHVTKNYYISSTFFLNVSFYLFTLLNSLLIYLELSPMSWMYLNHCKVFSWLNLVKKIKINHSNSWFLGSD